MCMYVERLGIEKDYTNIKGVGVEIHQEIRFRHENMGNSGDSLQVKLFKII